MINHFEQYYQRIRNSNIEKILYRYEYIILLACVETTILVLSGIGLPLIPLTIIPLAVNLKQNSRIRNLYVKWRGFVLVFLLVFFTYRYSYMDHAMGISYSIRESDLSLTTYFRPELTALTNFLFPILLLSFEVNEIKLE